MVQEGVVIVLSTHSHKFIDFYESSLRRVIVLNSSRYILVKCLARQVHSQLMHAAIGKHINTHYRTQFIGILDS